MKTVLIPRTSRGDVDWDGALMQYPCLAGLAETPQESTHHAEGDVLTHTRMVCDEAFQLAQEEGLDDTDMERLLFAAAFHDVGKQLTLTYDEQGHPSSPKHAVKGVYFLRHLFWQEGSPIPFLEREMLFSLIAKHAWPVRFFERPHPENTVVLASLSAPNRLLGLLAEADMRGRISRDKAAQTQAIETARLFRTHAAELGCLDAPYPFANAHSRFTYLSKEGETGLPFEIFDPTTYRVTMLCGLPGTGKDSWIQKNLPKDEPVLSRDIVRAELNENDIDDEGTVLQEVLLRTKQLLAKKRNFAINATNLRRDLRRRFLQVCHAYGAGTRVVFLHADRDEVMRRNGKRPDLTRVPVAAIEKFARNVEPPDLRECYEVSLVEASSRCDGTAPAQGRR